MSTLERSYLKNHKPDPKVDLIDIFKRPMQNNNRGLELFEVKFGFAKKIYNLLDFEFLISNDQSKLLVVNFKEIPLCLCPRKGR